MLAIGRALLTNPTLLIMDEPSEGLAPAIIESLIETFRRLEEEGLRILLIEQNLGVATSLAERQLIMVGGEIAAETTATSSRATPSCSAATSASSRSRADRCARRRSCSGSLRRAWRCSPPAAAGRRAHGPPTSSSSRRGTATTRSSAMNADGSRQQRLTREKGDPSTPRGLFFQIEPAWSPDGAADRVRERRDGSCAHLRHGRRRHRHAAADVTRSRTTSIRPGRPTASGSPSSAEGADLSRACRGRHGRTPRDARLRQRSGPGAGRPTGSWIAYAGTTPATPVRELWLDPRRRERRAPVDAPRRVERASRPGRPTASGSRSRSERDAGYEHLRDRHDRPRRDPARTRSRVPTRLRAGLGAGREARSPSRGTARSSTVAIGEKDQKLTSGKNNDSSPAWNPVPAESKSSMHVATVVLLGTLDTKGKEYGYLRDRLREQGVDVLLVDAGVFEPQIAADVTQDGGRGRGRRRLAALARRGDRGAAVEAMCRGAASSSRAAARGGAARRDPHRRRLGQLVDRRRRRCSALPVGVPKLIVSTVASGRHAALRRARTTCR